MDDHDLNSNELFAMMDAGLAAVMSGNRICVELFDNSSMSPVGNQFLFFIKPEVTLRRNTARFDQILSLILNKIDEFGFRIERIRILSGEYLGKYNVMAEHYGVINRLARSAQVFLSEKAKAVFQELHRVPTTEARILGGFEYLAEHPELTASDLGLLWSKHKNRKLAGGTYCVRLEGSEGSVFLINGFHPEQLEFFTGPNRGIAVLTLRNSITWSVARQKFVGATDPNVADPGSIRHELFCRSEYLGLPNISQGSNGVHLSAGPVEALVELCRFNSDLSKEDGVCSFKEFILGKELQKLFSESQITAILGNVDIVHNGSRISVFDLTEELDSRDALGLLRELAGQLR